MRSCRWCSAAGRARVVDVVGPVCESGDFFARDREMAALVPGDLVAMLDAGAYGMSLSSNYNTRPRPAEVLVAGRKVKVIRRRETVKELLEPESFKDKAETYSGSKRRAHGSRTGSSLECTILKSR